jgi:uncharacterized protein
MDKAKIQEFFDAVRGDDVFQVTSMIGEEPELANAQNEAGSSALMVAHYFGKKDIVNLLLQSGAKVDVFAAAAMGRLDRLEKLLASDPTLVNAYSGDGWTPLHLASFYSQKACAKALLDAGAPVLARSTNNLNNHPLHAAAAGRSRDIVAMLLEHGADPNATQHGGWTPLHGAAQHGDVELAKALLAKGANPDARADNNQTPLDLAMGAGAQELVDLLRAAGTQAGGASPS